LLFQLVGPERPSQILRIGPDYFEHAQAQPMQQAEDFLGYRGSFGGLPMRASFWIIRLHTRKVNRIARCPQTVEELFKLAKEFEV
jgi:hypothetical protein